MITRLPLPVLFELPLWAGLHALRAYRKLPDTPADLLCFWINGRKWIEFRNWRSCAFARFFRNDVIVRQFEHIGEDHFVEREAKERESTERR